MKTNNKIGAYVLRGSTTALLFSCVIVAFCSAVQLHEQPHKVLRPQDNAASGADAYQDRSLSFADRVAYQRAIEDVYWRHRIWPKGRREPKPSLDAVMSQGLLERKVEEYLRKSQALEDYWQRPARNASHPSAAMQQLRAGNDAGGPITADQLQTEMERMASNTRKPEILQELFEALGNDPFIIAECLARPVLAERFVKSAPAVAAPALSASRTSIPPERAVVDTPLRGVAQNVPQARGYSEPHESQRPVTMAAVRNPNYTLPVIRTPSDVCAGPIWRPTSEDNPPSARARHKAVWTGSEMIVWGSGSNTGGRYDPTTDSWAATSTTNAPEVRTDFTAVWTGTEMIIWGGSPYQPPVFYNTGGRYDPSTDSWTATNTNNAPTGRYQHTAVWTGTEMIVWGGCINSLPCSTVTNTGGKYDPITDSWTPTNTIGAPEARRRHTVVWNFTGSEMIVWGGLNEILD